MNATFLRTVVLGALVVQAAGCGTNWKQEAGRLQTSLASATTNEAQLGSDLAERSASLASTQAQLASLKQTIANLEAKVAGLERSLNESEANTSRILADKGALRDQMDSMQDALADLRARKAAAEARVSEFQGLVDRFRALIDAGTLDVRIIDGRMVVVLGTDILFDSGSAKLSDDGLVAIDQVAEVLGTIPDRRFQVEGHTDNVPIRTNKYPSNWHLAASRAINVVTHMTRDREPPADGTPLATLDADRVSAASFGDTRPVSTNQTVDGRSLNRRIEIVVVPDLSDLPGYEELQGLTD